MSLDPVERLAALRREVDAETPTPPPPPLATAAPPAAPVNETDAADPPDAPDAAHAPPPAASQPQPSSPGLAPTETGTPVSGDGWEIAQLLADTSLTTWLGWGLLAVGIYLVASWFVPGIDLIGSVLILGAGVVLLAQHLMRGAGAWALYAGAVLTGMGAARVIADILPGSPRGLTVIGIGCAFLGIAYLRHTQAGGYGWQGAVGGAAVGLGLVRFVLGLLPGTPSIVDLILPALLLIGGGFLLVRSRGPARPA